MIGINKCRSVNVCLLLTWLLKTFRKFDFWQVRKFCYDLSNVISGGNQFFKWDFFFFFFLRWDLVPLCELRIYPEILMQPHKKVIFYSMIRYVILNSVSWYSMVLSTTMAKWIKKLHIKVLQQPCFKYFSFYWLFSSNSYC